MRILSLLPSTTEIIYALGIEDQLVGVTHECDWPREAGTKPQVDLCEDYPRNGVERDRPSRSGAVGG